MKITDREAHAGQRDQKGRMGDDKPESSGSSKGYNDFVNTGGGGGLFNGSEQTRKDLSMTFLRIMVSE